MEKEIIIINGNIKDSFINRVSNYVSLISFDNSCFDNIGRVIQSFRNSNIHDMLFLHLDKMEDIEIASAMFGAKTLLVENDSSYLDKASFSYDYVITPGDDAELEMLAFDFVSEFKKSFGVGTCIGSSTRARKKVPLQRISGK